MHTLAKSFALLFLAAPLLAHTVTPTTLQIEAGQQATFNVTGCQASLTATSANSGVATVNPPGPLTATAQTFTVSGVAAGTTHITVTWQGLDPYYCSDNESARVDVTVTASAQPEVIVASLPRGLAQETNMAGAVEQFTLANVGDAATTVTLAQGGAFTGYDLSPTTAALQPGAQQTFTITGRAQPQGFFEGFVTVTGAGVPPGTTIPVRLVSANRPSEPPSPRPATNRVDVGAAPGEPQTGTVTFVNDGPGTVRGVFASDVPWIIPPTGVFQFAGFGSATAEFQIDLSLRPPDTAATGNLSLQYLLSPQGKTAWPIAMNGSTGVSTTLVTIVSTQTPPPTDAVIPPLGTGEIALFAPSIGRVRGASGQYISDLAVTSLSRVADVRSVSLYFTPIGGASKQVTLPGVSRSLASPLGDLVKSAFEADSQLGSLQVRSVDIANIGVAANIFISDNELGSFGTAIPIFRSDRSATPGERLVLSGLQKDADVYTNFYVQETSGTPARVRASWLGPTGVVLGSTSVDVPGFGVSFLGNALPPGAVAAVLELDTGSGGAFSAYATGQDTRSEDFWATPDWASYYDWNGAEQLLIPIAGSTPGANNTNFRTDLAVSNAGTTLATATLRYRTVAGLVVDRVVQLTAGETRVYEDVARSLFETTEDSIGYIVFTPLIGTGTMRVTSRTYNLVPDTGATFGTGVPAIPVSAVLQPGGLRRIGGFDDASIETFVAGTPATFRTNLGLVEVGGQPATVRVTLHYRVPSSRVTAIGSASKEYALAANQFVNVSRIANDILGAFRQSLGDLRNLQIDIEIVAGTGSVLPFITTVDNGTGDSILRTE